MLSYDTYKKAAHAFFKATEVINIQLLNVISI